MEMERKSILDILKKGAERDCSKWIDFPEDVEISGSLNPLSISFHLAASVASQNMQVDAAAFESWMLAIKVIRDDAKFNLSWDRPDSPNEKHYQRFLYRVSKFKELFSGWFGLNQKPTDLLKRDLIVGKEENYYLNLSGKRSDEPVIESGLMLEKKRESDIEKLFVKKPDSLKVCTNCISLSRQLPVGLFRKKSYRANDAIFPMNKAQIDLWGKGENGRLNIFELKKPGNRKMGVLTELFFYTMFIEDLLLGRFLFGEKGNICPPFDPKDFTGVKSCLLVYDWHPLINVNCLCVLNQALGRAKRNVSFSLVQYDMSAECRCIC